MRVLVVGGGPGGLFFALLAKQAHRELEIEVVEQNDSGATYGWGVVFTDGALTALSDTAPAITAAIAARKPPAQHLDVIVDNAKRSVKGNVFYRIGRADLLRLLQEHAAAAGVRIRFMSRLTGPEELEGWDLVVGADGVNSVIRDLYAAEFQPEVTLGQNWWAWFGTHQLFPAVSLIFEASNEGLFIGHAYQYTNYLSGFVVEVVPDAFDQVGFARMSRDETLTSCATIFASHLDGEPLLDNHSLWFRPKFVTCRHWTAGNVTLLGDALHTVHPSIGSGTRFAMRDAVFLAQALDEHPRDAAAALATYERTRRPRADAFQTAAGRSIAWYEALAARGLGDPTRFTLEYIMRTGRVRYEDFRRQNPELVAAYEHPGRATDAPDDRAM